MDTRKGFTLVELLIVVVMLGMLASIVVPQFGGASEDAKRGAFVQELRVFAEAAAYYRAREGQFPDDGSSGECPDGFDDYVDEAEFEADTPIGGSWDTELNDSGVTAAIGVHFQAASNADSDAYMVLVDAIMDDGDLSTGGFRKLAASRYYSILQP